MDMDFVEKILNLFDNLQSHGKPLELSIDNDLLKIFPLPKKLILDLLSDETVPKIFQLSKDQNTLYFQNNLVLCSQDQSESGSCNLLSCEQLHLCKSYLLNKTCATFDQDGKCSHSHSLSTKHNKNILEKLNLLIDDERTFELVAHLIKISLLIKEQPYLILQTLDGQKITDDLIDNWFNDHKSLILNKNLIDEETVQLTFEDDEIASMMENLITQNHEQTILVKKNLSTDKISSINSKNYGKDLQQKESHNQAESGNKCSYIICNRIFETNRKTSDLNRSSKFSSNTLPVGRGRGRNLLNNSPTSSLSSKQNSPFFCGDQMSSIDSSKAIDKRISFSHRLSASKIEDPSQHRKKQVDTHTSAKSKHPNEKTTLVHNELFDYEKIDEDKSSNRLADSYLSKAEQQQQSDNNNIHNNNNNNNNNNNDIPLLLNDSSKFDSVGNISSINSIADSKNRFVPDEDEQNNNEKSAEPKASPSLINYFYRKQFNDQALCYLLGPGRKHIIKNDQCKISSFLPSGYCQLLNAEQGKDIEKQLYSILPQKMHIQNVDLNDNLLLIVCSSAAESIFEQNQTFYAIITETQRSYININVIRRKTVKQQKSLAASNRKNVSSSIEENVSEKISSPLLDRKFKISSTDSSIDVISDDITQVPVDLMICISTSNNLCENVLLCAGQNIQMEYKRYHQEKEALLLDGGLTAAKKILFVPWQSQIQQTETTETKKSLLALVKWCINQAHHRNMKSISFPPIGTGQLGLDPFFVCETMINAAHECLQECKIDVLFVIYPSSDINHNPGNECYQIFKIYLDSLYEQTELFKSTINNIEDISSTNFDMEKESISRNILSKRILTLSNSPNMKEHHFLLVKSLKDLIYEKTFPLSLIESLFINQIDLLINICLKYNVYPFIDFLQNELMLRGDQESCFQCIFNLQKEKKVHQYSYISTKDKEKSNETKLNSFISLKIDEAFATRQSNICIKDDDQTIFNIDLNNLKIKINQMRQSNDLIKKEINLDSLIQVPSSWPSSSSMIRTVEINQSLYQSLECFNMFHQTISTNDWEIEQINSIENYPLYVHFINNKKQKSQLYFHGCSYSSVQSIIHYGLHSSNASNYGDQFNNNRSNGSICLTRDVLNSHLYGTRRSTDGKHYLFVVEIAKTDTDADYILLTNEDTYLALPTYLIVYQRRANV